MASSIVLTYQGQQAQFAHKKLDRSKLYGKRKRIALDSDDNPCARAELPDDGGVLIRAGMTAQGYFDGEGHWIPNKDLVGIDEEGKILERVPSTLGVACEMTRATPEDVLDLKVLSVYMLDPVELPEGIKKVLADGVPYSFEFNYRADYHAEKAFVVANDEGYFAIVGNPVSSEWLSLDQVIEETFEEDAAEDDDLDFEMF